MQCSTNLAQALLSLPLFLGSGACSDSASTSQPQAATYSAGAEQPEASGPLVLFLGDSLSAGLHLREDQAFPAVLQRKSIAEGHPFRLINAGVSGDTTAGGLGRLDWSLKAEPDLVVLELGANDGLRGIKLSSIEANLLKLVEQIQASGAEVLLLGMRMPPNYGPAYTSGFEALYEKVAEERGVALVPFFLKGVGGVPKMNLPDGIHPTTEGHGVIADTLAPQLWALLDEL